MLKFFLGFFLIQSVSAHDLGNLHLIGFCRIHDAKGNALMVFPGRRCLFADDGTFISLGANSLRSFDREGDVTWEFPVSSEYSYFTFSSNSKNLMVVTALPGKVTKQKLLLYVLSEEGKILHYNELPEMINSPEELNFQLRQIPLTTPDTGPAWLRGGNYILSGSHKGLIVLSSDLQKILHVIKIPSAHPEHISGFVFTPDGGHIIILNRLHIRSTKDVPVSTIEEYDLRTGTRVFQFPEVPHALFYIPAGGSIQLSESGDILANHPMAGLYLISRKDLRIKAFIRDLHFDHSGLRPPDFIRTKNLDSFLRNWSL